MELPSPYDLLFGVLILGVGYIGVWIKNINDLDYFRNHMKLYDKVIQSAIVGTLSFAVVFKIAKLDMTSTDIPSLLNNTLSIFSLGVVVVFFIAVFWEYLQRWAHNWIA